MIGLLAEPRQSRCAIGETTVRCLSLFDNAVSATPALSAAGDSWVRENSLKTVLLRHYPILQDALYRIDNPFAPWRCVRLLVSL